MYIQGTELHSCGLVRHACGVLAHQSCVQNFVVHAFYECNCYNINVRMNVIINTIYYIPWFLSPPPNIGYNIVFQMKPCSVYIQLQ